MNIFRFLAILFIAFSAHAKKLADLAEVSQHPFGPAAAQEFLKTMTVADGYEVTVFASEPLMRNPSNFDVDERGRIWVAGCSSGEDAC